MKGFSDFKKLMIEDKAIDMDFDRQYVENLQQLP